MANKMYEENDIKAIADAIRLKNSSTDTYKISQMSNAILNLNTDGGITPSGTMEINSNGVYDVTTYASALVNITNASSNIPNNVVIGELTVDNSSSVAITIEHNIGKIPYVVAILPRDMSTAINSTVGGVSINTVVIGVSCNTSNTFSYSTSVKSIQNITEQSFDFTPRSSSYPLIAGSYFWVALA